jgi:hypothetical protein
MLGFGHAGIEIGICCDCDWDKMGLRYAGMKIGICWDWD